MVGKSNIKEKGVVERAIRFLHEPQGSNVRSITNYATNVLGIPPCRAGSMVFNELQNGIENGLLSKDHARYALTGIRRHQTIGSHRHTRQVHDRDRTRCSLNVKKTTKNTARTPKSIRKRIIKSKTRTARDVKRGLRSKKSLRSRTVHKESSSKVANRNKLAVQSTSSGTVKQDKRKRKTRARRQDDSDTSIEQSLDDSSPKSSSTEMELTLNQPRTMATTRNELTDEGAATNSWGNVNDHNGDTASEDSLRHPIIKVTKNTDSVVETSIRNDGNNDEDNGRRPSQDSLDDELLDDSSLQDSTNNRMADE